MATTSTAATSTPDYRLFYGGEWVEPAGGRYSIVNPATEEVVGEAPEASRDQVAEAAAAAREAFPRWAATAPQERAEVLSRMADLLAKRQDEFVPLIQAETGATQRVASTMQVPIAIDRFR